MRVHESLDYIWQIETKRQQHATPPKSTKSQNSNSSVQIQIRPTFQIEFVPLETEESELVDSVDFGGVAFSVETVIGTRRDCLNVF